MLNILWPIFIILSVIYGLIYGKADEINNGIFESLSDAIELSITFLGTISLWNGIMEICKKTSLMDKLTGFLKPFINFLFPELKKNETAKQEISMNMIANILGLGNAATPLGLKAMKTMQEKNPKKDTITDSMAMFIVLNTASLQIIPSTVIAVRTSLNSAAPTKIIFAVWVVTILADITGIIATKILMKRW